ncbi:hypothetical protein [Burkholderia sp. LMU1-1-1.1]|uniref:hypothetical protein n=1 Tax=Burkholderia sp. LMU1-1-1.1 TaxID=3135266 RepID=UPI00344A8495
MSGSATYAYPLGDDDSEPAGMDNIPFGESAPLFRRGEGASAVVVKEKPKKVYGAEHWAAVEDVLDNFILIYGEDLVWDF